MDLVWKVLIGAVGVLVVASVATGVVAASSVEGPAPRETIVVDTTNDEGRSPGKGGPDDRNSGDAEDDQDDDGDIDSVRVEPDDLDDAREDAREALEEQREAAAERRERLEDRTDDRADDSSGSGSDDD